MTDSINSFYGLSEAARLCGVKAKQLLYWEVRGYIPTPERIALGEVSHRQYTNHDLELIRRIKSFLDEGYSLSTAAKKAALDRVQNRGGGEHE